MTCKITTLLALCTLGLVAGCDTMPIDTGMLAPVIGERNAHILNAGGHLLNAGTLGEKDENAIGESVALSITNHYPLSTDDNLQRYVTLVGLSVAGASSNPGGHWIFGVIESTDVNAFSGPNGYVFITRGAIMRMNDEAELAGVLSHEVAHVCNHDGLKQVQVAEQRGALGEFMKAGDSRVQQLAVFADAGVDAITKQGYSQPQELAADEAAVHIMAGAGYDAASYLRFLQRLQSQGASAGGQVMSTHPGIASRISRVSQALPKVKAGGATLAQRFVQNVRH